MSTTKKKAEEFDYQAHFKAHPPETSRMTVGPQTRLARRTAKQRITLRVDEDILEKFKELSAGHGYQSLINQALREWLTANDAKTLILQMLEDDTFIGRIRQSVIAELKRSANEQP